MDDDTPVAPEPSGQSPEPTPEPAAQTEPTPEPTSEPTPPPEPTLTPEQILEQAAERGFQKTASWIGRRDKDLIDNIGNLIDRKMREREPAPLPTPLPDADPAALLSDPKALNQWAETVVPKILHREAEKLTKAEQTFNAELIRHAAAAMDSDPLFEDKDLGNAVVGEITKNFGSVNKNLPPDIAAQLLVHGAVANIMRTQKQTKPNPLAKNKPGNAPMGTVKPPPAPAPKVKPVKLSESAQALAKRWNYSAEDIAKLFGE